MGYACCGNILYFNISTNHHDYNRDDDVFVTRFTRLIQSSFGFGAVIAAWDHNTRGVGFGELGKGTRMGSDSRRTGDLPRTTSAVGHSTYNLGHRIPRHCIRRAPKKHGERHREEEVPRRRFRPLGLLQAGPC